MPRMILIGLEDKMKASTFKRSSRNLKNRYDTSAENRKITK